VNSGLVGAGQSFSQPSSVTEEEVLTGTGMQAGEVDLPNGETVNVTGEDTTEIFAENNVPGTTTYDFAVGATDDELNYFWNQYQNNFGDSDSDSDSGDTNEVQTAINDFLNQFFGEDNANQDDENDEDSESSDENSNN